MTPNTKQMKPMTDKPWKTPGLGWFNSVQKENRSSNELIHLEHVAAVFKTAYDQRWFSLSFQKSNG